MKHLFAGILIFLIGVYNLVDAVNTHNNQISPMFSRLANGERGMLASVLGAAEDKAWNRNYQLAIIIYLSVMGSGVFLFVKGLRIISKGTNDDPTRLRLINKYNIERNAALNKYVVADKTFFDVEDALLFAASLENLPVTKLTEQSINDSNVNSLDRTFSGIRDVSNDAYKLHLVNKYNITKNEVLGKFVLNNKLYDDLDKVLAAAYIEDNVNADTDIGEVTNEADAVSFLETKGYAVVLKSLKEGYPVTLNSLRVCEVMHSSLSSEQEYDVIKDGVTTRCKSLNDLKAFVRDLAKKSKMHHLNAKNITNIPRHNIFEGDRNIENSLYQLFLTRRFSIEKNSTLDKYVIGNQVFNTLQESLREADEKYTQRIVELENEHQKHLEALSKVESDRVRDEQISKERMMTDPSLERILRNNYSLVKCEFNKGQKIWTLRSKTNGQQFDLNGQQELDEFATSFPPGNEVQLATTANASIVIPESFRPNSDRKWPR